MPTTKRYRECCLDGLVFENKEQLFDVCKKPCYIAPRVALVITRSFGFEKKTVIVQPNIILQVTLYG